MSLLGRSRAGNLRLARRVSAAGAAGLVLAALVGASASGAPSVGPTPTTALVATSVSGWHVPVLMYHHVGTGRELGKDRNLPGLNVAPVRFAQQMAALHAAGWHTITAAELGVDLQTGQPPAPKTFVVTFDDGHEDAFLNAYPALITNGYVGTFYVITHDINFGAALRVPEVIALATTGMEIGDHTVHHVGLAQVAANVATQEIEGAASWIAALLGSAPTTLAYPYGDEDAAVVADVQAAGFTIAFTNKEGCFESTATRFVVPRLRVGPETSPAELLGQLEACAARG